jgi:hypothetical protein
MESGSNNDSCRTVAVSGAGGSNYCTFVRTLEHNVLHPFKIDATGVRTACPEELSMGEAGEGEPAFSANAIAFEARSLATCPAVFARICSSSCRPAFDSMEVVEGLREAWVGTRTNDIQHYESKPAVRQVPALSFAFLGSVFSGSRRLASYCRRSIALRCSFLSRSPAGAHKRVLSRSDTSHHARSHLTAYTRRHQRWKSKHISIVSTVASICCFASCSCCTKDSQCAAVRCATCARM